MAFIDYEDMAKRNAESLRVSRADEVFTVTAIDTKNHIVQLNGSINVDVVYTLLRAIARKDCAVKNFDVLKKEIDVIGNEGNKFIVDTAVKNLLRMSNYIIDKFNLEQNIKEVESKGTDWVIDTNYGIYFQGLGTSIYKNECPGFKGLLNNAEIKDRLDRVKKVNLICLTAFDGTLWLSCDIESNYYTINFDNWDTANNKDLMDFNEKTGLRFFKEKYVSTYANVCGYIREKAELHAYRVKLGSEDKFMTDIIKTAVENMIRIANFVHSNSNLDAAYAKYEGEKHIDSYIMFCPEHSSNHIALATKEDFPKFRECINMPELNERINEVRSITYSLLKIGGLDLYITYDVENDRYKVGSIVAEEKLGSFKEESGLKWYIWENIEGNYHTVCEKLRLCASNYQKPKSK